MKGAGGIRRCDGQRRPDERESCHAVGVLRGQRERARRLRIDVAGERSNGSEPAAKPLLTLPLKLIEEEEALALTCKVRGVAVDLWLAPHSTESRAMSGKTFP